MTPKQLQLLDYLREYIARTSVAPTLEEARAALSLGTKSNIHRLLGELEAQGHIRRTGGRIRSIELVGANADIRRASTDQIRAELARRGVSLEALVAGEPRVLARGTASCAADCCQLAVEPGHLMCRRHWFQLPADLREDIHRAHRRADRDRFQMLVTEARDLVDSGMYQRVVERVG